MSPRSRAARPPLVALLAVALAACGSAAPPGGAPTPVHAPDSVGGSAARADTAPHAPWFYRRRTFGSEAFFDPLSEILNEGYDFWQIHGRDRHFLRLDYAKGMGVIWRAATHPDRAFRQYGWDHVLREELFPLSGPEGSGAWIPNYQLHLLGGGMVYTRMEEWYAAHGWSHAKAPAIITMAAAHLLNELVEDTGAHGYPAGPIIDLFVFDAGGIALFQSERVRRFAATTLGMTNWPGLPSVQARDWTMEDASQWYVIQWKPPHGGHWRVFGYMGIGNMLGVTHRADGGTGLSVAAGLQGGELVPLSPTSDRTTVSLNGQAGLFWDREGSLLGSVIASSSKYRGVELTLYPEHLRLAGVPIALWAHLPRAGGAAAGLAVPFLPGIATPAR